MLTNSACSNAKPKDKPYELSAKKEEELIRKFAAANITKHYRLCTRRGQLVSLG